MKKRKIDVVSPEDLESIDSATKALLSFGDFFDVLDTASNQLVELPVRHKKALQLETKDGNGFDLTDALTGLYLKACQTMVKLVLEVFEKEAKIFLKKKGLSAEKAAETISKYKKRKDPSSVEFRSAINMLLLVARVKRAIEDGRIEEAVLNMMRLSFAAAQLNLHELVIRGIRVKAAPGKGGKASKKPFGILEAIRMNLEKQNMTPRKLWRFFSENYSKDCSFESNNGTFVYFYPTVKGHMGQIVEDCETHQKKVGFERFRKHISTVRKQMKKK